MDRFSFLDCKALPIFWPFDFCGSALPQQNSVMSFFFLNLGDWICWNSLNAIMQHSVPCTTIPHDWVWIWQHTSAALRFLSNVHAHLVIAHVCSLPQQRLARTETQLTAPPKQKNGSKEKHPVLSTRVTKHSVQTPKLPVRECDVRVKVVSTEVSTQSMDASTEELGRNADEQLTRPNGASFPLCSSYLFRIQEGADCLFCECAAHCRTN